MAENSQHGVIFLQRFRTDGLVPFFPGQFNALLGESMPQGFVLPVVGDDDGIFRLAFTALVFDQTRNAEKFVLVAVLHLRDDGDFLFGIHIAETLSAFGCGGKGRQESQPQGLLRTIVDKIGPEADVLGVDQAQPYHAVVHGK